MADLVIMMLGLIGGVVSYLANPCGPEQWAVVKAARPLHDSSIPTSSRGADRIPSPARAPIFDPDLADVLA